MRVAATTYYVDAANPTPAAPYTTWSTAATNIQDAVDAATVNDLVFVTDGIYEYGGKPVPTDTVTNRVMINNGCSVQSVNGPLVTTIMGFQVPVVTNGPAAIRCVYLGNGSTLSGFTLTNGATPSTKSGAGVYCGGSHSLVTNCIVAGNGADSGGAGGVFSGTVMNCIIEQNTAMNGGGGGGVSGSVVLDSILRYNFSSGGNGGGAAGATLTNCVVLGNVSKFMGAAAYNSALVNCTVISNISYQSEPSYGGAAKNCITYYNFAHTNTLSSGDTTTIYSNCCVFPATAPNTLFFNQTSPPAFTDLAGGDLHLSSTSPCINAGKNSYITPVTNDIEGNPRIVAGSVDIGAYEYQTPGSIVSYAFLEYYGLATDGSADHADPDGDGMDSWTEWRAGTNPTNAASVLAVRSTVQGPLGTTVSWNSILGKTYFVQRADGAPLVFNTVLTNIPGMANTTSKVDTGATNMGPYFFRVGVVGVQ